MDNVIPMNQQIILNELKRLTVHTNYQTRAIDACRQMVPLIENCIETTEPKALLALKIEMSKQLDRFKESLKNAHGEFNEN